MIYVQYFLMIMGISLPIWIIYLILKIYIISLIQKHKEKNYDRFI